MRCMKRLLKKNELLAEPMQRDWSALAREFGKRNEFIEALATQPINFIAAPQSSPEQPAKSGEEILEQLETMAQEIEQMRSQEQGFQAYTYTSTTGIQTLPIFSAEGMVSEFTQKTAAQGNVPTSWIMVGIESPNSLLSILDYMKLDIKILINPFSKYSYEITPHDLKATFEYLNRITK